MEIRNTTSINIVDYIKGQKGTYQAIVKVKAGFMTAYEVGTIMPKLSNWKKGALQTIQFRVEGSEFWLTVFARKGKTIVFMDKELMAQVTVGEVNQLFFNTNLYDQHQYSAVNAKTWADKVFVENKVA